MVIKMENKNQRVTAKDVAIAFLFITLFFCGLTLIVLLSKLGLY